MIIGHSPMPVALTVRRAELPCWILYPKLITTFTYKFNVNVQRCAQPAEGLMAHTHLYAFHK
jgi:hypothetical protein